MDTNLLPKYFGKSAKKKNILFSIWSFCPIMFRNIVVKSFVVLINQRLSSSEHLFSDNSVTYIDSLVSSVHENFAR